VYYNTIIIFILIEHSCDTSEHQEIANLQINLHIRIERDSNTWCYATTRKRESPIHRVLWLCFQCIRAKRVQWCGLYLKAKSTPLK